MTVCVVGKIKSPFMLGLLRVTSHHEYCFPLEIILCLRVDALKEDVVTVTSRGYPSGTVSHPVPGHRDIFQAT